MGNVRNDPLPAMVLINPTTIPVKKSKGKYHQSILNNYGGKCTLNQEMKSESIVFHAATIAALFLFRFVIATKFPSES